QDSVLGVLSLILWSLIIVVFLKYITLVMRADHRGEGGILALVGILMDSPSNTLSPKATRGFVLVAVFGAALLYGDGMITPAISVLSAVEGLEYATPALKPYVIPLSVGILVGFFACQSA